MGQQPLLITYDGKTQSIREWSQELGVNKSTIRGRFKRGDLTTAQVLGFASIPYKTHSSTVLLTYKGKTQTIKEWSHELGISKYIIRIRLKRGDLTTAQVLGFESFLSPKAYTSNTKLITYDGRTMSQSEWTTELGFSNSKLHGRIKAGWTIAQALGFEDKPRAHPNASLITFQGVTQSKSAWARSLGICKETLSERLVKWPFDEALTTPRLRRPRSSVLTVYGVTKSRSKWAAENNIDLRKIRQRLANGWTPEEAVLGRQPVSDHCNYHPSRWARSTTVVNSATIRLCWGCAKIFRAKGSSCSEIKKRHHRMKQCVCKTCKRRRDTARENSRRFYKTASPEQLEDRKAYNRNRLRKLTTSYNNQKLCKFLDQFDSEDRDFIIKSFMEVQDDSNYHTA